MSTFITTTTVEKGIPEEYIRRATDPFVAPMAYASIMEESDFMGDDEISFDGKAKIVSFPLEPSPVVKSGAIAQTTVNTNSSYTLGGVSVTIQEYGNMMEKITGLAVLQRMEDQTARLIDYVAGCAGLTFDDLFAAAAVKKTSTTIDVADSSETTDWAIIQPSASHKTTGYLTKDDIDGAVIKIQGHSNPFKDGLFRGMVHKNAAYGFERALSATGNDFKEYSLARQAGVDYPAEYAQSMIGVWGRVLWKVTQSAQHVISAGAEDGSDAYKTLIFGAKYLGAAFVPLEKLILQQGYTQIPISKYVGVRISPDTADVQGRNSRYTFYFVGGVCVRDWHRGFFWVHKVDYVQPGRA